MSSNSTISERRILTVRPNTWAIVLQFRNILQIAVAVALLHPYIQSMIHATVLNVALGRFRVTEEMLLAAKLGPSVLVVLRVAIMFLYQKTCSYSLTDERLIIRYGIILRVEDEVELYRVVDVAQTVGILQRIMGVGNIYVSTTDRTGNVVMPLIKSPANVRNAIRTEAERCKNRRGSVRILE